jgi:hypothetical protein
MLLERGRKDSMCMCQSPHKSEIMLPSSSISLSPRKHRRNVQFLKNQSTQCQCTCKISARSTYHLKQLHHSQSPNWFHRRDHLLDIFEFQSSNMHTACKLWWWRCRLGNLKNPTITTFNWNDYKLNLIPGNSSMYLSLICENYIQSFNSWGRYK